MAGPARNQNFVIAGGDNPTLTFTLAAVEGVDLASAEVAWWAALANKAPDNEPVIQKKTGDGATIAAGEGGSWIVSVELEEDDTLELAGDYYHETCITLPGGALRSTVAQGTMTVLRTIIRAPAPG